MSKRKTAKAENTLPYPWNPEAKPPHSIAHLFVMAEFHHRDGLPPGSPALTPAPASYFTIGPKTDPERNKKMRLAKI